MNSSLPNQKDVHELEAKLQLQEDEKQQMVLIDRLIGHLAFTDVQRAKNLLGRLNDLLSRYEFPDLWQHYLLFKGFIENQLYDYEESEKAYLQAIELLDERGDVKQQASAYINFAGTYINMNQREKAVDLLDKAGKLLKLFPDKRLLARLSCREGYIHLHLSDFTKAIESFLEADKRYQELEMPLSYMDYYFQTLIYSGLGKVYEQNSEWEKSVYAYSRVAEMCEQMGMRTRLAWHYLNVGVGYMAMNDGRRAETYFQKAIQAPDDTSQQARANAFANLGFIYFNRRAFRKSLVFLDQAEALYEESEHPEFANIANLDRWRAQLYLELHDKEEAMEYFIAAYENAQKTEDYKLISSIYKDIATFYAQEGDFQNAYEYQILYDSAAEKYAEKVNRQQLMELEIKYEAEQKKKEAELLRLQATKLQLKALRAQMNPHFMYNALNAIQNYITSNEIKNAAKYLAKFAQLMRQSLEYSDLEIISLEKELEFLRDYLTINQKLRFENLDFEIEVDDDIEEDILGVPTMIVQPYVENAIEHGLRTRRKGQIYIRFSAFNEYTLMCIIEDNGIGREAARRLQEKDQDFVNHKSRGTSITEKRLEILHQSKDKEVFVNTIDLSDPATGESTGTRVEIQIPIVEIQIK